MPLSSAFSNNVLDISGLQNCTYFSKAWTGFQEELASWVADSMVCILSYLSCWSFKVTWVQPILIQVDASRMTLASDLKSISLATLLLFGGYCARAEKQMWDSAFAHNWIHLVQLYSKTLEAYLLSNRMPSRQISLKELRGKTGKVIRWSLGCKHFVGLWFKV